MKPQITLELMSNRIKSFRKLTTENRELNRVQDYLGEIFEQILLSEVINGVLLKNIDLTTGQANNVEHKLNRAPLGWTVIRKRADANIWDAQDDNVLKTKTIDLRCDADVTVDLWVF